MASSLYPVQTCDSKRIEQVQVYGPKWSASASAAAASNSSSMRLRWYHAIFGVLYVYQVGWVLSTTGEPYRLFLEKADREGFAVMQGATVHRAELEHSLGDINNPNRRIKKIGYMDWMDMDMEELVEEKKKDSQQSVMDSLTTKQRVPSKWATGFMPTLILGILGTLHALVVLMQFWNVRFLVWMNYQELDGSKINIPDSIMEYDYELDKAGGKGGSSSASSAPTGINKKAADTANAADKAKVASVPPIPAHKIPAYLPTHARISPTKEKPVLVPLEFFPTLGMTFEYHRRRFLFVRDPETGDCEWTKVRCRTDLPLGFLGHTWKGFASEQVVEAATIRYGPNIFEVKQPEFLELYKKQLLNPFTVFQLFCVLLWAIDDYIIYSCFSLFMVLLFEGTVVFQRLKSLQALRGMGNTPRPVYVYRNQNWMAIESTELLPGDIMSLTRHMPKKIKAGEKRPLIPMDDSGGDVVPADLLLLRGSTVVNEASLTGESVPQMKEGLADLGTAAIKSDNNNQADDDDDDDDVLDMKNRHKMNVAYAGTKMLQCLSGEMINGESDSSSNSSSNKSTIPSPPDNGAVCFVLRTGFSSAQGKLVRMIEGSQEKVKGHEKDTGLLLLVLCFFAMSSSSYVLYHGLQSEGRSQYELLLHCIMIVTSVIRPELPMQMAMQVNNSLMTLMKMHIFCTEPYRVPMAGKLDACLFDKTGTLTTDELVAVGVLEQSQLLKPDAMSKSASKNYTLTPMIQVHNEAALVMAGCHSLVVFDEETTGDPLEMAAMKSIRWHLSESGKIEPMPQSGGAATDKTKPNAPLPPGAKAKAQLPAGQPIKVPNKTITGLEILVRHHFSSKLQRMSCVVRSGSTNFVVAKGSPEAIGNLLATKPSGYDATSEVLAKEGYRMIGLAYKPIDASAVDGAKESRSNCETDLIFAGFIAFTCRVRKDTSSVLQRLKEGGMKCTMVTGDALLTAIHVAKEVYICETVDGKMINPMNDQSKESEELNKLLASKGGNSLIVKSKDELVYRPILYLDNETKRLSWKSYEEGTTFGDYEADKVPELSKTYDLATTGKCLASALEFDREETRKVLGFFKVFARMTPDAKETVIQCLQSVDSLCMMCGDGANDVGALKAADVGVALLTGFGDLNVDRSDEKDDEEEDEKDKSQVTAIISQEHLNQLRALPVAMIKMKIKQLGVDPSKYPNLIEKEDLVKLYQIKAREVAVKRHDMKNAKDQLKMTKADKQADHKANMADKQRRMAERVRELEAKGESWAQFKAMKEFMGHEMAEGKKKKQGMTKARGIEGSAASMASQLEEMDTGDMPVVKLGDASIAAPFTSKMPSIKNCVDIVRQGRCTLVSTIQMYQILALQSLISSYSLSVLYLDGVKYGDTQMTALGLLGSVSFMSVSRSKPLDRLSSVRPLTSIFHPSLFLSLLGQFAIHLTTMVVAVRRSKVLLGPDYEPDLDGTFKPGILNTVVFLVNGVQQVTVFVVNLQGRPFMTGVTENRPLLWSLLSTFILTFMFASESVPAMNRYFQLVPFPDDATRDYIVTILVIDLVATYVWDLTMKFIFARDILIASFKETTWSDVFKIVKTFAIICFFMYSFLGSDEQWEEIERAMAEMDGMGLDEDGDNATLLEGAGDAIKDCVGDACDAVVGVVENISQALHDEF